MKIVQNALDRINSLMEKKGVHIVHTSEISRSDREILLKHRWLEEIIRGWYLVIRPDILPGDSTAWFSCFWDFLKIYLDHHYGTEYCLSAECSLNLHVGVSVIPKQIIVTASKGSGTSLQLPFGTSLLVYSDPTRIPKDKVFIRGLQVMPLGYALCKVAPVYFRNFPQEAEIALRLIHDPQDFLKVIVQHNFKSAAGRLIGAFRFLGNTKVADGIKTGLEEVGMKVEEVNPFERSVPLLKNEMFLSPYVARIHAMWEHFRHIVLDHFSSPPGLPKDKNAYMKEITESYTQDAYNSLSIEGYRVTEGLIEKVRKAEWNPDFNHEDKERFNALTARGYYEAHLLVKESVLKVLGGGSPGRIVADDLQKWYQKMFGPLASTGIFSLPDLFGYRRQQVYIRGSRHTPPSFEYVKQSMDTLYELLEREPHAGVRAVLGHFIFVYIHPYMDGNGRMGRFFMNVMLASGGYPWTIIHATNCDRYMSALESASVDQNILPFVTFISKEVNQA